MGYPTVAIVGGGLAGLAAACALAESGFRVTLFERRPFLGGRASSYEHPGTGEVVDNCQHVLFKLCTNLLDFYRRIGIDNKIRWFDRMTFIEPGGRQSILESAFLPAPLHAMPAFLRFKFLSWPDKISLARALSALITRKPQDDGASFEAWLRRYHQTPAVIERFWKPILVSALSEDLDRISVPFAAQVVRESMKSRDARVMGVPKLPLTELYNSARDYILAHGGEVRLRSNVQAVTCGVNRGPQSAHSSPTGVEDNPVRAGSSQTGVGIRFDNSEEQFDFAVLAVPFDSLAKLLPDASEFRDLREKISHFENSPITGVHLWFDRQVTGLPHAVLLDRTIQWMFHKSMLLTADQQLRPLGATDNSPALQRWENPRVNPSPVGTSESPNRSYVELVISSSKSLIDKSRQDIIDLAVTEVREFFPPAREANLVKATVIKEVNATFSPVPGIDAYRPSQSTAWPRLFLAGDWTATGWPATMEGAVRSGYLAAAAIRKAAGDPKNFLVPDLPARGLMRLFW